MVLGLLHRFPAYTYTSLLDEDPELFRLIEIEAFGRPDAPEGGEY